MAPICSRARETLQQLLQDESGRYHGLIARECRAQCLDFSALRARIAPQRQ
jgi:hypothetical protein